MHQIPRDALVGVFDDVGQLGQDERSHLDQIGIVFAEQTDASGDAAATLEPTGAPSLPPTRLKAARPSLVSFVTRGGRALSSDAATPASHVPRK